MPCVADRSGQSRRRGIPETSASAYVRCIADAPRVHPPRDRDRDLPKRSEHAPDHLDGLNAEQREGATALGAPLLIVAGADTGKSRTLVHRVA